MEAERRGVAARIDAGFLRILREINVTINFYTQFSLVPPKVYCVFKGVYLLYGLEFPLGKLRHIY